MTTIRLRAFSASDESRWLVSKNSAQVEELEESDHFVEVLRWHRLEQMDTYVVAATSPSHRSHYIVFRTSPGLFREWLLRFQGGLEGFLSGCRVIAASLVVGDCLHYFLAINAIWYLASDRSRGKLTYVSS